MRVLALAALLTSMAPAAAIAADPPADPAAGKPAAETKTEPPTKASFPSSGETYGPGDAVIPQVCIPEFTTAKPKDETTPIAKWSAPPDGHAKLLGPDGKEDPAYNAKKRKPGKVVFWVDTKPESDGTLQGHFVMSEHWYNLKGQVADCSGGTQGVKLNTKYFINTGVLDTYGTGRRGITYGALTIPYKWHGNDHSIDAAPTIGAFVGGYIANPGVAIALVFSGGIGTVPVPTTKDGQPATDLKTSVSIAAGPVVTLTRGQRFQLGLLVGTDWVGAAARADYKYNGKLWVALSLGVELTK